MRIVMKRLVLGTLLLLLVCITFTLPSARADQSQSYVLNSNFWTVEYKISDVLAKRGQRITLDVTFTAKVTIYDFSLKVLSNPVSLVPDDVWTFPTHEIGKGLPQLHTFNVNIPDDAATGTKYQLDLQLRGYNDAAKVDWNLFGFQILYWRYEGWFSTENPQYTQDTKVIQGQSVVITVT